MSEHTPGPWSGWGVSNPYVCGADYKPVCTISTARSEYHANARLIAAAPDLLEALEELTRCHVEYCKAYGSGIADNATCVQQANVAIAKARGQGHG